MIQAVLDGKEIGQIGLLGKPGSALDKGIPHLIGPRAEPDWQDTGLEMDLFHQMSIEAGKRGVHAVQIPDSGMDVTEPAFAGRFWNQKPRIPEPVLLELTGSV